MENRITTEFENTLIFFSLIYYYLRRIMYVCIINYLNNLKSGK